MASQNLTLGQEVFVLSANGGVERTMVASLSITGRDSFLNGMDSTDKYWLDYDLALVAAQERFKAREASLRKQLSEFRRMRTSLSVEAAKLSVMKSPYRVVNLCNDDAPHRTRKLKNIQVPNEFPKLGTMVYVVISPQTGPEQFVYRPFEYFVLETKVTRVCFTTDGKVHLRFSTPFNVEKYFLSRREAKASCEEKMRFVSYKKEATELPKIDDIPF